MITFNKVQDHLVEIELACNENHFIHFHGRIEVINKEDYLLDIGGLVNRPKRLTMSDLKKGNILPCHSAIVTT